MDFHKIPRRLITTEAQLKQLVRDIQDEAIYAADTEFSTVNEYNHTVDIAGMSVYLPSKRVAYYIPINHTTLREQPSLKAVQRAFSFMADRKAKPRSLWHFFKADYKVLLQHGIDVWDHKCDTWAASCLLDDNSKGPYHGLKYLSRKNFNYDQVDYSAMIAINEIRRHTHLRKMFDIDQKTSLYDAFEKINDRVYRIEQRIKLKLSKLDDKIRKIKEYGDNTEKEQKRIKELKKQKTEERRSEYLRVWYGLTHDKFIDTKRIHDVPMDLVLPYATDDVICTYELYKLQKPRLEKIGLLDHACNYQTKLAKVLGRMELRGIPFDRSAAKQELKATVARIEETEARIQSYLAKKGWQYTPAKEFAKTGRLINLGSGPQLSLLLFRDLGLTSHKTTKSGKASVDASVLDSLDDKHKLVRDIKLVRTESKIKSTYLESLIERATKDKNGVWRIHATFNQFGAATGRLSSKQPNAQNMPQGPRIRSLFKAPKFWRAAVLDYSQLEIRILASFSGDRVLRKAYASKNKTIDIHRFTAANIYSITIEKVSNDQRKSAKTMQFGILYQMGEEKLARSLGIPLADAREFIDNYFGVFSGVKTWIDNQKEFIEKNAYSVTLLGRRRRFPHLKNPSIKRNPQALARAARQGVNAPIQGTGQDICGGAMIRIEYEFYDSKYFEMNIQVHDELVNMIHKKYVNKYFDRVKTLMEEPFKEGENPLGKIPLVAEGNIGKTWSEAKG